MENAHLPVFNATRVLESIDASEDIPDIPDPAPQYRGDDVWLHWEMVDRANRAVNESQALLADLEPELKAKTEEVVKLKERSSKLFETVHSKPRLRLPPTLALMRSSSVHSVAETKELALQEFQVAHKEETASMLQTEELTAKVESLKENIERNKELASTVDQVFELLGASVAANLPDSETRASTEERLAAASSLYDEKHTIVTDFSRACVTVQHAHHYYTTVLKTIDSVRGTSFGRLAVGGLGEISKQRDYKVALDTAYKAQVCFNETVRVLTPHIATIPPKILDDFEWLKERGLLQASKIYGLMYGWRSRSTGITKSVELMLQRQEEVFVKLTHLAIWVQDEVPVCEAQLRAARESRDQVRRGLALQWKIYRHPILDIR